MDKDKWGAYQIDDALKTFLSLYEYRILHKCSTTLCIAWRQVFYALSRLPICFFMGPRFPSCTPQFGEMFLEEYPQTIKYTVRRTHAVITRS